MYGLHYQLDNILHLRIDGWALHLFSGGMKYNFLIDNRNTDFHLDSFENPDFSESESPLKFDFSGSEDPDQGTKLIFDFLDIIFKRKKTKEESIKRIEKEKEGEGGKGEEETKKKKEEVEFVNPMVFDRLAVEKGVFEIKYLVFLPLNGDAILMSPEHGQIYSNRHGHA